MQCVYFGQLKGLLCFQLQAYWLACPREATKNKFLQELEQERQLRSGSQEHLRGKVRFAKMQIEESRLLVRHLQERIHSLEVDRRLIEGQLRKPIVFCER
jgi:hypothetical protein